MKVQVNARNRAHHYEAGAADSILCAGLGAAVGLSYECGSGTCGTCKAKLVSGELHDAWPEAPGRKYLKQPNEFLMCQCSAKTDVVVELGSFVHTMDAGACVPAKAWGRVKSAQALTHDVMLLDVALSQVMAFDAGQYALVRVPGIAGFRGWSMVNYDRKPKSLQFVVKKKPGGGVSEWLFSGRRIEGEEIEIFGPLGHATFHPSIGKHLLCIAGGSGIAGMMAIVSRAVQEGYFTQFDGNVFFGVRTMRDAFFLQELAAFRRAAGERLKITIALSDEDVQPAEAAKHPDIRFDRGFVHEVAKKTMDGKYANTRAYIAGPPPAVDASIRFLLLEAKLPADQIKYDKFS
jgi:toluene monooxygenase electron transfer component